MRSETDPADSDRRPDSAVAWPQRAARLRHVNRHARLERHKAADRPAAGDQVRNPSPIGSDGSAFSDRQLVGERHHQTLWDVAGGKRALVVHVKVVLKGGPPTQEVVIAGAVA